MNFDPKAIEQEVHDWFFVEYFDRWVAKGAGESNDEATFISNYWNSPMFVSAPPAMSSWLTSDEHVFLFFQAQQELLQALGYTHTDIPDQRIRVFTEAGAEIDVIWSRCAGDQELERLVVNFQVMKLENRWKVVGIHSKYTDADNLEDAWTNPGANGPFLPDNDSRFPIEKLDAELRDVYSVTPNLPFHDPKLLQAGRLQYEFFTYNEPEAGVDVREVNLENTMIRTITPQENRSGAALLWIHGGGLVAGRSNQLSRGASLVAKLTGATAITVNYRLAPEHPYPAAHTDCHTAWTWIQDNAESLGIDPKRIVVVGSSAGGGLAAGLCQRLVDEGGPQPAAQVLFYPMLDDRTAADNSLDDAGHYVWGNRENRVAWNAYLAPNSVGDATLPGYASPARRDNLSGLPPTWIGVGSVDLFHQEATTYAERLEAAGVPVEYLSIAGAPHVFEILAPQAAVSQQFLGSALTFLSKSLA
ncbi:hypothetical protein R50073_43400 [Maricurvus nonylphenolicus]|uniref:alpha/beta hydrolase n=1 Tax=Maricurvus nonylphenolicus TaxID=1008307 RepID=UPI0036F22C13